MECAFVAQHLPREIGTLLDFGSGAGFPGIPIAICRPEIQVTLAESQRKKAAFLEEAVRLLGISSEVFGRRVETMPDTRGFDAVALRAVDKMQRALSVARPRASKFLVLITTEQARKIHESLVKDFVWQEPVPLPYGIQSILLLGARRMQPCHRSSRLFHVEHLGRPLQSRFASVPRGTKEKFSTAGPFWTFAAPLGSDAAIFFKTQPLPPPSRVSRRTSPQLGTLYSQRFPIAHQAFARYSCHHSHGQSHRRREPKRWGWKDHYRHQSLRRDCPRRSLLSPRRLRSPSQFLERPWLHAR